MTETLSLEILPEPPKEFIRGQDLEFLMDLPATVPVGFFEDSGAGISTAVQAQLRCAEDASDGGFIADLDVTWEDAPDCTQLRFKSPITAITAEWPLGLVEFDVLFVKTTTVNGTSTVKRFRSLPVRFKIVDGVSREILS